MLVIVFANATAPCAQTAPEIGVTPLHFTKVGVKHFVFAFSQEHFLLDCASVLLEIVGARTANCCVIGGTRPKMERVALRQNLQRPVVGLSH